MNRRRFLSLLGLAAPAMALDPERALWVPGEKTIFDLGARHRGIDLADHLEVAFDWTEFDRRIANQFVLPDWVIQATEARLTNYLKMSARLTADLDSRLQFKSGGGATVQARMPVRYTRDPSTT